MMNQLCVIGRITNNDKNKNIITLAVQRATKNSEGIYETDFIPCQLSKGIAENGFEYCQVGDLVGVKGKLENNKENGLQVMAEKVTFLSSRKGKEEE